MAVADQRLVPKPILPVDDMASAVSWHRRLGFEVVAYDDSYAWVRHRGEEIYHLATAPELDPSANTAAVYLHVQDSDEWHRAWSDEELDVGPIADRPWAMREFAITDPSGNLVRVGHNL